MAIEPKALGDHVHLRGPKMFHVTTADAVGAISADGLRPGSELGFSSKGGFFLTRAGHVYLADLHTVPIVAVTGKRAYLEVDLRQLDPSLIDPDEDQVQSSFDLPGGGWVAESPPVLPAGTNPENARDALARWADTTKGFDGTEVTEKSLRSGRVSYRGTIPNQAIRPVALLSEGAEVFRQRVLRQLNGDVELPPTPELGFYETEVARAIALARSVIRSAATGAGEPADTLLPEWLHSEHATYTRDLLIRAARDHGRSCDLRGLEILGSARQVAQAVPELQPELGWSSSRDACLKVAEAGAQVITCLRDQIGNQAAANAAGQAMAALGAVPDQS